jgi:hypothetical protein
MKFTKSVKNISMFIWPQTDDICEVDTEHIVVFLPEPIKSRRSDMIFPVSFSGLHAF